MACRAWKFYEKRCKQFDIPVDKHIDGDDTDHIKAARVTVMEFDVLQALILSLANLPLAKIQLNQAITMLGKAKLVASDLNQRVWHFAGLMARGHTLE